MTQVRDAFQTLDYGPAPESENLAGEWLHGGKRVFGHYIGGRWTDGEGAVHQTRCPGDGRLLASFRYGTSEDIDQAVTAAAAALPEWQAMGGHARSRHLYRLARQIQKRSRLFAVLESLDNGKAIREARDLDIPLAARHFHHHAGWAQLAASEFPGYEPVGVVGQIIPWNFPLLMLSWKVAPALAAGNTVVLKPAEYTPLSALLFAEVARETGLPPGVLNIVTGDGATGAALTRHDGVAKIAFTGSTEVGREIRRATAGTGRHLSLELGGKSPFVVFESADLDAAVEGIVDGVWLNQGQVCCAGSRLLVQESVEEEMLGRLRARMERIRVGHPLDKSIDMGAIVDASQKERIEGFLTAGAEDGATIWQPSAAVPDDGFFLPPTLCTGAPASSTIVTDEIFGPVLVSLTFRTPAEAVALANDTRYGLAASIWTEDLSLALDVAPAVKAGTVWVNCTNRFDAASGFGGYRESGFGREGGREGMWEYLKPAAAPEAMDPARARPTGSVPGPAPDQLPHSAPDQLPGSAPHFPARRTSCPARLPAATAPRATRPAAAPPTPSTAPASCGSAAGRRVPTAAIRSPSWTLAARPAARCPGATARTSATRSRRPRRPGGRGVRPPPTCAPRSSTSWPRTSPCAPTSSPRRCPG